MEVERKSDRFVCSEVLSDGVTEKIVYEARSRKEKLTLVFLSYAEVIEESGASIMKLTQFTKLLIASMIIDESFNKTKAEIFFKAVTTKHLMDFNTFMVAMVRIGETKYKELTKDQAAEELIIKHLLPLYSSLWKGQISSPLSILNKLILDPKAKQLLNGVVNTLLLIYKQYTNGTNTVKNIFALLRDFDLLRTNSLTKQGIVLMVYLLITTEEVSLVKVKGSEVPNGESGFTFDRFVLFLYWYAVIGFDVWKQTDQSYSPAEKVYYLLARMQHSKGLNKRQPHCISSLTAPLELTLKPNLPKRSIQIPEQYKEQLQHIFTVYCHSNTNKMPLYTYLSLLKDCGIIGKLSTTEAELLFMKTARHSTEKENSLFTLCSSVKSGNRVNIETFYIILVQIAEKLYPSINSEQSFEFLFKERLMNLAVRKDMDIRVMLDNEEIWKILKVLKKALSAYIDFYLDKTKRMNFDSFVKFCKDFGVFPELTNKHTLQLIFSAFIFNPNSSSKTKESINEDEFIEALSICALKSSALSNSTEPIHKIIRLAERISRSSGIAKIKRTMGVTRLALDSTNFLGEIKNKYKNYFNTKKTNNTEKSLINKILNDNN